MTTIYFVRHAEPNHDNHDDAARELTPKGMADRILVTEYLSGKSIDTVLSSPYKRAVDTLRDYADTYNFGIKIVEDFRERKFADHWVDDFQGFARRSWSDFDYKLSGGETLREVQERNIAALRSVLKIYADKNIVIGSHGTALSTIIHYYDHSFGYDDFERIRPLMPWIVKFVFIDGKCGRIEPVNLFESIPQDKNGPVPGPALG